ncbi:CheR family methyltransferase [Pseudomonas saudiphocaensis]|uniref:Chemotaxis protein methyltransferase n=1 Tax=Pseudomonas saudiphocaensis TaxID=1499686 RepID=A0A078LKS6_9PSED|nr:protein-glutamate O-methyltransferase [Pseudomonas saudiphocaensis]CDZ93273.1 protein-glutamate O-methyltransferase [Pseudomonas saudiphocaensis]
MKSLSPEAFRTIQEWLYRTAGIQINAQKSSMVVSRLWRRVDALGLEDFNAYLAYVFGSDGAAERAEMLDRLTTNETYFFREPAHFARLKNQIIPSLKDRPIKVWCAAASTGEEPYSLAMVLDEQLGGDGWQLVASDICGRAVQQAKRGIYRLERLELLPVDYLKTYCRRGTGTYQGMMMIDRDLRTRVRFEQHNLLHPWPEAGGFDVIFLRNVLIYFDQPTRQRVIDNLCKALRPGGWLITGHCESLAGIRMPLQQLAPSVYRESNTQQAPRRITA